MCNKFHKFASYAKYFPNVLSTLLIVQFYVQKWKLLQVNNFDSLTSFAKQFRNCHFLCHFASPSFAISIHQSPPPPHKKIAFAREMPE
jgi:hypothetical protein